MQMQVGAGKNVSE